MNIKKAILLFLALLFPVLIFMFLKFFGRNEFDVPPLYVDDYPEEAQECGISLTLPYHIPEPVKSSVLASQDSLVLVHFGDFSAEGEKQWDRVTKEYGKGINLQQLPASDSIMQMKKCVFFSKEPFDLVLVDREGLIRGQYISSDREEVDRLLMELAILFKKY